MSFTITQILDFASSPDISITINNVDNVITVYNRPDNGEYGIFQMVIISGDAYIRIKKSNIVDPIPALFVIDCNLDINYIPSAASKNRKFPEALTYINNQPDTQPIGDGFIYFSIVKWKLGGLLPIDYSKINDTFWIFNLLHNFLNTDFADFESGIVPHSSSHYARAFELITQSGEFTLDEIYIPRIKKNVINGLNSLITPYTLLPISPINYNNIVIQANKLVITTDTNSTKDLWKMFILNDYLYLHGSLVPVYLSLTDVVILDGVTSNELGVATGPGTQEVLFNFYDYIRFELIKSESETIASINALSTLLPKLSGGENNLKMSGSFNKKAGLAPTTTFTLWRHPSAWSQTTSLANKNKDWKMF